VLLWNVTSRIQYKTKFFSNLFGDKKRAVYIHTIIIFSFGLSRDFLYKYVVNTSNFFPLIDNQYMTYIGYMILLIGIILVSSATYKLGLIGTFNGDAYGFLLPSIIKSFPFNLFNAPMYLGSTLNFLGYAIINKSLTGIALTILVGIVYFCGNIFEE
jgi:methylene-fatty-acyl-phospholipid synthase